MKNLELLEILPQILNESFDNDSKVATSLDSIYYLKSNYLHKYSLECGSSEPVCPHEFDNVINLKYLALENKVCVTNGNCLTIISDDIDFGTIEFNEEITTISWSPNDDTVAIVFLNGTVNTYNIDYDNYKEFPQGTSSINATVPDTVYVGWGSKDTQFRGAEGKLKKNHQEILEIKQVTDQIPRISWRGNGEMFAVNYWKNGTRNFIVFGLPCKAIYHSENTPGMGPIIAWRPAGNMIATLVEMSNQKHLVIFEKNGQKRFSVPLDFQDQVDDIQWSPCGQILTILSPNLIRLMTSSNYKWYEKQQLRFRSSKLLTLEWIDATQCTYTLKTITKTHQITYTFKTQIHSSITMCAVINGHNLQITDFQNGTIPPPMYEKQIEHNDTINFITFNDEKFAIIDTNYHIIIYDRKCNEIYGGIINFNNNYPLNLHHFKWLNDQIVFLANENNEMNLYSFNYSQNGYVELLKNTTSAIRHLPIAQSTHFVDNFNDFTNSSSIYYEVIQIEHEFYHFLLTVSNHFYLNNVKVNDKINSFIITDKYLLLTTKLNELFCVRLKKTYLNDLMVKHLNKEQFYYRNIEQGANIICSSFQKRPEIILQMPRGNLETITCSLILIDLIDDLLQTNDWSKALYLIRLYKLNVNLLIDLNPDRFLKNIANFIDSNRTTNELTNFVLDIENDNLLTTIYKNCAKTKVINLSNKSEIVFKKMSDYFYEIDYAPYITTLIVMNYHIYSLREALKPLQHLLKRSQNESHFKSTISTCISTLKSYGCDDDQLYGESLLLYDVDLAQFVVNNCQMDPRIYEPQLDTFRQFDELHRRYAINVYMKKFGAAIKYLLRLPELNEQQLNDFIKLHNVSLEAYRNCPRQSIKFTVVSRIFATDLRWKGKHDEAGIVLKRAKLFDEALEQFKLSLNWREVVNLMEILNYDNLKRIQLINEFAVNLTKQQSIQDAAYLFEHYANNYEMAMKIFIENYSFKDALHLAYKYKRQDVIESQIIPGIVDYGKYLKDNLNELEQTFDKYCARLNVVRQTRTAIYNDDGDDQTRNDQFSETDSVASTKSFRSKSSTMSSRNRRKEARKRQELREGGIYEDIALIRALHILIRDVHSKGDEINNICCLLLQETNENYATIKELYKLFKQICTKIQMKFSEIWPAHFYLNNTTQILSEMADIEHIEHLDPEFRTPPILQNNLNLFIFDTN